MVIDAVLLVLCVLAIFKGVSRGLIAAVFSFLALFVGLAAAIKLSVIVAEWLQKSTTVNKQWLPFLSFVIVIFCVALLVRWLARLLQKSVEFAMLGWVNRLGGILFYLLLYVCVYSIVLFYGVQMAVIKPEALAASRTYQYIGPVGPWAINRLGMLFPVFKDLFTSLENFFGSLAGKK